MVGCIGAALGSPDARAGTLRSTELPSPAPSSSAEPHLASAPDGSVFLSWLEPSGDEGHTLRFSRWEGKAWSAPRTVHSSPTMFANWADFPSLLALPDGTLVAHWLEKTGEAPYAYDVRIVLSRDGGATWSAPMTPHRDRSPNEHGFVSLIPRGQSDFAAVWLDGRKFEDATDPEAPYRNEMMLLFRAFEGGAWQEETILDGRVCDCCQTAASATAEGIFVTYRDRSDEEVRDVGYVTWEDGVWSSPRPLYPDGWEIAACPVNGPAVAVRDDAVAVTWFSLAGEERAVKAIVSLDGGKTFGTPLRIDEGDALGRVDVEWLDDDGFVVSWLERGESTGEVRVRRVWADGRADESVLIGRTAPGRTSGFPRMARYRDGVLVAWTEAGEGTRVRVANVQPSP